VFGFVGLLRVSTRQDYDDGSGGTRRDLRYSYLCFLSLCKPRFGEIAEKASHEALHDGVKAECISQVLIKSHGSDCK